MNKSYRIVWSESRGTFIVAHEKSSTRGKPSSTRKAVVHALAAAFLAAGATGAMAATSCGNAGGTTTIASGSTETDTCVMVASESLVINGTTNPATGINITTNVPAVTIGGGISISQITNEGGTIHSSLGNAIQLTGASTISMGISNSGTISTAGSARAAIYMDSGNIQGLGSIRGIVNSGTLSASAGMGIFVEATNNNATIAGITNSGSIVSNGFESIRVEANNHTVSINESITNDGTYSGSGRGLVIAISNSTSALVKTVSITGSIINNGTIGNDDRGIDLSGEDYARVIISGGITNTGTIAAGMILQQTSLSDITNSGTIGATGSLQDQGLELSNNTSLTGNITNSNLIQGSQTGIYVSSSSISGGIINQAGGTISGGTGTNSSSAGVFVSSEATVGSIANSGIITGGRGIAIKSSTIAGAITNNATGTISGITAGIAITSDSVVNGGITNSGRISADGCPSGNCGAITLRQNGTIAGIVNLAGGTISGTVGSGSGSVSGIYATEGTISGGISNAGLISSDNQHGIFLSNADGDLLVTGGINNSGTILGATSTSACDTSSGDTMCSGIVVEGTSVSGGINNSGSIGGLAGIAVSLTSTISGGITNSGQIFGQWVGIAFNNSAQLDGDITNSGSIGGGTVGILIVGSLSGNIANSGTIRGATSGTPSFYGAGIIISQGTLTGNIVNSGSISGMEAAIAVDNGTLSGSINNTSTLQSTSCSGATCGTLLLVSGSVGSVTNAGTISGSTAIYSDAASTLPTVLNQAGGLIDGKLSILSSTNLTNAGTISLPEATQSTIAGNFTQSSTGVFKIGASSNTSYSTLTVGGTASLAGKASVNAASVNTLAVGQTLSGVISAGAVSGNFGSVDDNSALINFESHVNGSQVDFYVVPSRTVTSSARDQSNSPALPAAGVLDQIRDNTPAGMTDVVTKLNQLSSTNEVSDAASQTMPLLVGSGITAAQGGLTAINKVIQSRNEGNSGLSSGDEFYGDRHFWLKPFGTRATQADQSVISGYKANIAGMALGLDGTLSDAARLGISFAYANASIDGNSSTAPSSANNNLYALIGYGSYSLDDGVEAFWQADIGNVKNKGKRDILFMGSTAKSSYATRTYHVGGGLAKTFTFSESDSFTPSVRIDYTHLRDDAYAETGAGSLNLNVNARTSEALIYSADGRFAHKFGESSTLLVNLGVGYDDKAKASSVVAAYAGASDLSFTTTGIAPKPWLLRGGLGWVAQIKDGPEITARYDIEHREGFNNQTVSAKMRWAF